MKKLFCILLAFSAAAKGADKVEFSGAASGYFAGINDEYIDVDAEVSYGAGGIAIELETTKLRETTEVEFSEIFAFWEAEKIRLELGKAHGAARNIGITAPDVGFMKTHGEYRFMRDGWLKSSLITTDGHGVKANFLMSADEITTLGATYSRSDDEWVDFNNGYIGLAKVDNGTVAFSGAAGYFDRVDDGEISVGAKYYAKGFQATSSYRKTSDFGTAFDYGFAYEFGPAEFSLSDLISKSDFGKANIAMASMRFKSDNYAIGFSLGREEYPDEIGAIVSVGASATW